MVVLTVLMGTIVGMMARGMHSPRCACGLACPRWWCGQRWLVELALGRGQGWWVVHQEKKSRSNGGLRRSRTPRCRRGYASAQRNLRGNVLPNATKERTCVCKATSMRTP
jgi:hypothetical protein